MPGMRLEISLVYDVQSHDTQQDDGFQERTFYRTRRQHKQLSELVSMPSVDAAGERSLHPWHWS
jgi:hypothetical protein